MQQYKGIFCRLRIETPKPGKLTWDHPPLLILTVFATLALVTLACAFVGPSPRASVKRVVIRNRLPTLTPTSLPVLAPTTVSDSSAVAMSTEPSVVPPPAQVTAPTQIAPVITQVSNDPSGNPSSSGPILTALVGLNVRVGPGVDYAVVGKLAQGQLAQIIGKNPEGTWWQIVYPSGSSGLAWVSADAQYSTVSNTGEVQIAQLPPPPPPSAAPTSAPVAQLPSTPIPADSPAAQLPQTPIPASNPTAGPTATPSSGASGWAFAGVRVYPNPDENGLLLYGQLTNNTGSSQELLSVTGAFYDAQGQVIANKDHTYAYWPGYVIPPSERVPFELFVDDIDSATDFDLSVEAEPSSETPRYDFEFIDVNQRNEEETYCVEGKLRNPGSPVEEYLAIAAVLYDSQDNVVNFGDYEEFGPTGGGETVTFEICVDPPNQEVARYELRAWGQ